MPKKTAATTAKGEQNRTVYEVRLSQGGPHRIEAGTTAELRDALARLLPTLEPYAVQAAARLASIERATVTASTWSVRRIGVMQFQPDEPVASTKSGGRAPQVPTVPEGEGRAAGPSMVQTESASLEPSAAPEVQLVSGQSKPITNPLHRLDR
jgi:hypothetical protein